MIKTSFKSFALVTRQKTEKAKQQIAVKRNILIRGNLRKCTECGGIRKIILRKGSTGFYPDSIVYPHKQGCTNKF